MDADTNKHQCNCDLCQPQWFLSHVNDDLVPVAPKREAAKMKEATEKVAPVVLTGQLVTG